ncbi:hypothetical protein [Lysobacter sp. Root604]|uniref:hypothetical protein n=1 Tax=Lysobacter sp. Root604 TaxID=1736568 RepID=UPI001F3AF329|nr:hypothetical protein [Lysobacter sp. Root604]
MAAAVGAVGAEDLDDVQRDLARAHADHAGAVVGRGDGAGNVGAVAAGVGIPTGRITGDGHAGEIFVGLVDARIDHADLDAGAGGRTGVEHAVVVGVPHVAGLHLIDAVGHALRLQVARLVDLDRLHVGVAAQGLDGLRRGQGHHRAVEAVELIVDHGIAAARGGQLAAQRLDALTQAQGRGTGALAGGGAGGASLELDPNAVRVGLFLRRSGAGSDHRGQAQAQRVHQLALLHRSPNGRSVALRAERPCGLSVP